VGRIERGMIKTGQQAALCKKDGSIENVKISRLYVFSGLKRIEADSAMMGDIVAVSGISNINIGETICNVDAPEPYLLLR